MSMTAMCARDVIGALERFTHAHRDRFFANVKMSQPRHERARVELVYLPFEQPDREHLPVHAQPQVDFLQDFARLGGSRHFCTPDIRARTSNTTAKSSFSQPMPRAAVRNSLLTAVVGTGTFSLRPNSIASSMSFCIMLTSNQASSGCCKTNGPRYTIIGDAIAL